MAHFSMRKSIVASFLSATLLASPVFAQENLELELKSASTFAGAFLAGGAALQEYDFEAAAFYYADALNYDPENVDLQRELMIAYINTGKFEQAIPLAEKLKDKVEVERIARLVLGVQAIREGRYDEAQPILILKQANDIERLITGIMRAWALQGAGNTEIALKTVDELAGPDWFDIFKAYHGALIANAAGRDDTMQRFEEAMNDANGGNASPLTYLRIAEVYAAKQAANGDIEDARTTIERGLAIAPNNPPLLRLADTIDSNPKTLTIDSPIKGVGEILLNLASAINREGAETFATIYLEMARVATPDEPQIFFELGDIAERLNLTERAIELYASVPESSALFRPASLQQGLALSALDRNEEAVKTLKTLVKENPSDYAGYMALGGVLSTEKRYDESIDVYKQALTQLDADDPRFWPLHYRLGISYERTKQWPKAEETFLHALELSPNQPDILNYLGYSWVDMNMNLDEGLEMIQKAVEMRPRDGYITDSLGWAYYRLGDFEKAVESLERATDLRPRDATINDHLGDAYWRVGRKLEAIYQWSQVLGMEGEDIDKKRVIEKMNAANQGDASKFIAESIDDNMAKDSEAATGNNSAASSAADDG
ncbi:tetratricopeptide repeat protein [Ahrensia marina]|uniref:tetratricopeptide repeat protein n=1 Tax=Ahrensia marina TaxID=1514904 RepID=UPI0006B57BD6|nr:tetratricopeptide repeat protein [Ahrensia marina]